MFCRMPDIDWSEVRYIDPGCIDPIACKSLANIRNAAMVNLITSDRFGWR